METARYTYDFPYRKLFKSYYVVWKPMALSLKKKIKNGLNRTM